jgi:lysophospholipase L1-like esterase
MRNKIMESRLTTQRLLCTVLLFAASTVLFPDPAVAEPVVPVKIMALGDSITHGTSIAPGGYRVDLEDHLVAAKYDFNFVGTLQNGPSSLESRRHEGHSGYRIDQISTSIESWVTTNKPDFVLLMIGTNDVLQNYQLETAPERLSGLIDQIAAVRPSAQLLVSSITPLSNPVLDEKVRTYNSFIPGIVENKIGQGKNVSFVDLYPAITTADLPDGIHPNATGHSRMAAAWLDALAGLLPAPPPPSELLCPCTIWPDSAVPATRSHKNTTAHELGVKLRTDTAGYITGIRFFKGRPNQGTHVGHLWTRTGTLLATATFTNETVVGWQEASFDQPVPVSADTTYVASYFAPVGRFATDAQYFADRIESNYPLQALATGMSGSNGVFLKGSSGFPATSSKSVNYWVDVVFDTNPQ